jgi:hypothetical protein
VRRLLLIPVLLVVGLAVGGGVGAAPAVGSVPASVVLSDEGTLSRWAHALTTDVVRAGPSGSARVVARLRYETEDRQPEVYLALASRRDRLGRTWVRIRLPRRPNGTTGRVQRGALGPWQRVATHLRVNRRTLRATLYRDGRRIWQAPIGVGTPSTPTPAGSFYIRERIADLGGSGLYGPLAFGTSAYSTLTDWPGGGVVGIHGTDRPGLVPGRPSHGCVRLRNADIRRLARLMPIGTTVRIL